MVPQHPDARVAATACTGRTSRLLHPAAGTVRAGPDGPLGEGPPGLAVLSAGDLLTAYLTGQAAAFPRSRAPSAPGWGWFTGTVTHEHECAARLDRLLAALRRVSGDQDAGPARVPGPGTGHAAPAARWAGRTAGAAAVPPDVRAAGSAGSLRSADSVRSVRSADPARSADRCRGESSMSSRTNTAPVPCGPPVLAAGVVLWRAPAPGPAPDPGSGPSRSAPAEDPALGPALGPAQDPAQGPAGGPAENPAADAVELALVHRPKYDDWSFPKGKLHRGESAAGAALREVKEETGFDCVLGQPLPTRRYVTGGRPKEVRYWSATPTGGGFAPNREVDRVVWLPVAEARERLSQPHDEPLIDALLDEIGGVERNITDR